MPHLVLPKVLSGVPGVKRDGDAFHVNEDLEATAFISLGNEVLQVARVLRLEVTPELVTLHTQKGDRFYFPPEQVVGIRLGGELKSAKTSAGFTK
jgi:hypothetical protein